MWLKKTLFFIFFLLTLFPHQPAQNQSPFKQPLTMKSYVNARKGAFQASAIKTLALSAILKIHAAIGHPLKVRPVGSRIHIW